jgi:hypothetical protein
MSVIVLAVSRSVVAVGADRLYLDFSKMPPEPHFDHRKVFRGDHVVGAMTGVADTPAGSLLDELVGAMSAPTLADAVKTFRLRTQPWLTSAYRQWRSSYGANAPKDMFAAVVIGGITKAGPEAVELLPDVRGSGVLWSQAGPFAVEESETYIGAYGVVDTELRRHLAAYAWMQARGLIEGPSPGPRPAADADNDVVLAHVYQLIEGAVAREAEFPRPNGWAQATPVLGGMPMLAAVKLDRP